MAQTQPAKEAKEKSKKGGSKLMGRLFFCLVLLLLVSFAIFFLLPDEDEFEGIDGPSSSTKKAGKKKHKKLSKEELYDAFIDTPEKEAPSVMMQARSQKNWADTDWEDPYVEFVDENEILDRIKTEEFTGVFFYSMDSDHHRFAVKRWWSKLGREMKKRHNITIFNVQCEYYANEYYSCVHKFHKLGIRISRSSSCLFQFFDGKVENFVELEAHDGDDLVAEFESHVRPLCAYAESYKEIEKLPAREYRLITFVEKKDKLSEHAENVKEMVRSFRSYYAFFQVTDLDFFKDTSVVSADGKPIEVNYGDVVYVRLEDKKVVHIPKSLKGDAELDKFVYWNCMPLGQVIFDYKLTNSANNRIKKIYDGMDEQYELPTLTIVVTDQDKENVRKVKLLGHKLLKKYEGRIFDMITLQKKKDFNLVLTMKPELEYTSGLKNFIVFSSSLAINVMKEDLSSETAIAFLDKAIENYEILIEDEREILTGEHEKEEL